MKSLTRTELNRLLSVAKAASTRDYLMILVCTVHGLRVSELIALRVANFRDSFLTVPRLKGSSRTVHPLLPVERDALYQYMATLSPEDRLFPVCRQHAWRIVRRHCASAGIPVHKSHPHTLKATCAKHALKGGMQIDDLQRYIGWKSLASASAYLQSDEEEAAGAFANAFSNVIGTIDSAGGVWQ
jgi:type 1 fimbriae regulatory protein FimB